jgi:steroid delta-isomerase-like uncharacterized protein
MNREQLVGLFIERQAHWRERDAEALAAAHHEHGVIISPIFGTVIGRAAIAQSYRELFTVFEDWALDGGELVIDGARAAQLFVVQATHTSDLFGVPATGRRFEIHGVLFFTFEEGLILREQRLYDFSAMLIQLGVIKART